MKNSPPSPNYHLFVLKVWRAEAGDSETEWRGSVQAIASREKRYFRDWDALLEFVQAQLQPARDDDFLLSSKKSDSE